MSADPLFAAEAFGKSFRGRVVLKAASIWGRPGRVSVLFGRNGSGKSTLLKVAVGLVAADYGVVRFQGRSYTRPRLPRLAREGLFYLPDRGLLSRRWSVRRHLEAVAWRFGGARIGEVVERLGLADLLEQRADELSGGERRRAEIAVAALRAPVCLLADEPLAGIGPVDAEVVGRAIRALADAGAAVVVTGHEVASLLDLADEAVWMVAGTTHGLGAPSQAAAHEQFRREYLGPATAGIAARAPIA